MDDTLIVINEDAELESTNLDGNLQLKYLSEVELQKLVDETAPTIINIDPFDELTDLLGRWDHLELLEHFKSNDIDIDVLKNIECHHLPQILKPFSYRTLIMFESRLRDWRDCIGKPLFIYSNSEYGPCRNNTLSRSESSSPFQAHSIRQNIICSSPSSPRTSQEPPSSVSLATILNSNLKNISLVESYELNQKFNEQQRTQLINAIAGYFDSNKMHLDLHSSYALEKEITERFKSEKLAFYRTSNRGRIYNKYCNIKFSHKPTVITPKPSTSKAETVDGTIPLVVEDDADQTIRSLKYDSLSVEAFDRCWKACSNRRLSDIKNSSSTAQILLKWPEYKHPTGYRLIEMDFSFLYPNAGLFLESWDHLSVTVLKFLSTDNHVKEKSIRDTLSQLSKEESNLIPDNCRAAALLWALHGYFVPFQKVCRRDKEGRKSFSRFTIKDSQNAFVWVGATVQEVDDHIRLLNQCADHVQPFIMVVGDSILNFNSIYLYFDKVKYVFKNFLRAVDICFKIFYLFNLQYPTACSSFWGFIETQYFTTKNKSKLCAKTHVLLNEINNNNM